MRLIELIGALVCIGVFLYGLCAVIIGIKEWIEFKEKQREYDEWLNRQKSQSQNNIHPPTDKFTQTDQSTPNE